MKSTIKLFTLSLALFVTVVSPAAAQPIQLDDKGKQIIINVPAGDKKPVTAYVLSKGNETQFVTLNVQAPNGTKVTAKSLFLGSAKAKDAINKTTGWTDASFLTSSGSEFGTLNVGNRSATTSRAKFLPSTSEYYCGNATVAEIDEVIALFIQIQGVTYTRDQLCALYGYTVGSSGGSSGGSTDGGSGSGGGYGGGSVSYGSSTSEALQVLVRKDTCAVKSNAVYIVRFDLDFSGVKADSMAQGADIYISATPVVFRGSKASSLKPTSDGKFAPKALFLMATTGGGYSGEKMTLVKWSKNKASLKSLKIEDMVYWRSHSLVRVVAEPVLKGGVGVAELQSNAGVYSVCFRLVKSRQKYNGYS